MVMVRDLERLEYGTILWDMGTVLWGELYWRYFFVLLMRGLPWLHMSNMFNFAFLTPDSDNFSATFGKNWMSGYRVMNNLSVLKTV